MWLKSKPVMISVTVTLYLLACPQVCTYEQPLFSVSIKRNKAIRHKLIKTLIKVEEQRKIALALSSKCTILVRLHVLVCGLRPSFACIAHYSSTCIYFLLLDISNIRSGIIKQYLPTRTQIYSIKLNTNYYIYEI